MITEPPRSRQARATAEQALVRVVHHYGTRPEFVLLGGLVPELLCARGHFRHAGTTDIDVQVDLEISTGSANATRLEHALRKADFVPDGEWIWRWVADGPAPRTVVKFELLADYDTAPAESTITFKDCQTLGAVNLRGTGFASRDAEVRQLTAWIGDTEHHTEIYVTGLAGFLLAKTAAARSRRKSKDWYDLAFVLLHNDAGGPGAAAHAVRERFGNELGGATRTSLDDLAANFAQFDAQGPAAYTDQMLVDHPDLDPAQLATEAILAVQEFHQAVFKDGT